MLKIGICGHFDDSDGKFNGQTVKTKILSDALERYYRGEVVTKLDTEMVHKQPLKFVGGCISLMKAHSNIIILPAQSAIKVLVPFFTMLKSIFKRKLHYYVVGGWLIECLDSYPWLLGFLKKFDGIYVELESMLQGLEKKGLSNVFLVNKFRDTTFITKEEIQSQIAKPYKLCFFSRVLKEKGVEDAINSVKKANDLVGETIYTLDIYGPIDDRYSAEFEELIENAPKWIRYMGVVDYHQATPILKEYFAMLFPTYYSGEGYPNAIVDAFAAGLPVFATDWKYNSEVIRDQIDGFIYNRQIENSLTDILVKTVFTPEKIVEMKYNVCERAHEFKPENAIKPLIGVIER